MNDDYRRREGVAGTRVRPARSEGVRPAAEAVVAGVLRSLRQPPADPRQSLLALRILRV